MSVFPNLNPYKAVATLFAVGLGVVALMSLAFSWMARGQEIETLRGWQAAVVISATDATVEPDAKGIRKPLDPSAIPAAVAKLKRSADSCLAASAERDRMSQAAVQRADNADRALAAYQTVLRGEYSSAEKRIKALESVKAAATPDLQCQAIGVDSKAAWEGWQ